MGNTRRDRIENEEVLVKVSGLCGGQDEVNETRWFRHVKRRCTDVLVGRYERLAMVNLRTGRGRLKKYWEGVVRQDMTHLQLIEGMTL